MSIANSSSPSDHDTLKTRALATLLVLLALLVPGLTLTWIGLQQFGSWTSIAVPYAMGRILIAHLIASLPMGMWIAWRTHRMVRDVRIAIAACAVGVLLAGVSLVIANPLGSWAISGNATRGFLVRSLWVLGLQVPWCYAAVMVLKKTQRRRVLFWADVVTALLLMAIPHLYTVEVVRRQSQLIEDAVVNQQYRKALNLTNQLYVLRSPEKIAGQDAEDLLTNLSTDVQRLSQQVQQPLPTNPTTEMRLQRALQLYRLSEYDAMRRILGTLPRTDPRASYRLAGGLEAKGDWSGAVKQYRATIQMISRASDEEQSTPELVTTLRSSYERLVNNLRRAGEYAAAESALKEGMQQWPAHRDLFLLQLGLHYQLAGRTQEAVEYFEQARQTNPRMREFVDQQLSNLDRQAQGCLLRSPQAATR